MRLFAAVIFIAKRSSGTPAARPVAFIVGGLGPGYKTPSRSNACSSCDAALRYWGQLLLIACSFALICRSRCAPSPWLDDRRVLICGAAGARRRTIWLIRTRKPGTAVLISGGGTFVPKSLGTAALILLS